MASTPRQTLSEAAGSCSESSDEEDGEFEFCYKFRPLYADDPTNSQRAEDEGVPWMSGSGIFTRREPPRGPKGSKSDGYVSTLAKLRSDSTSTLSSGEEEREADGWKRPEGGETAFSGQRRGPGSEKAKATNGKNESEDEHDEDGRVRSTLLVPADLGDLLITEEDERQTVTVTRAQWKRWQHQEAYLIALTQELERLRQQVRDAQLADSSAPDQDATKNTESEKDRKMREFKEMMAARYSNIRADAQGYKEKVIVDYYANRLEQRQKNVRARASGTEDPSTTPRATSPRAKSKGKSKSLNPSLSSSSSSTSFILSRFKKNS